MIEIATIQENYQRVAQQVEQAARAAGRNPAEVRLVAVTKTHPLEAVRAVIEAGAQYLGENYVEEGVEKILACTAQPTVQWHMIGHVQSRKAQAVAQHFHWLHSLDSLKLAQRLSRFSVEQGRSLPVLIECNISGEETKFGWPAWDESQWERHAVNIAAIATLPGLELRGLMTMAPYADDPEVARPYFQKLRRLRDFLRQYLPKLALDELSMGMSGDFVPAVEEGATLVRVGSAIFGPRQPTKQ